MRIVNIARASYVRIHGSLGCDIHGSLRRGAGVFEAGRDAADSSGCDCEAVAAVDEDAFIMAGVAAASAASADLR